jgi:hypothetical protein
VSNAMFLLEPIQRNIPQTEPESGNYRKQHALPTGPRTGYKMRGQIVASLLCLMMVWGSLDGLPDPPALKPQGNRTNLISKVYHHVPVAAKHPVSDRLACAPHFRASVFSLGRVFESSGPSYEIFLRLAADTSPPCFS